MTATEPMVLQEPPTTEEQLLDPWRYLDRDGAAGDARREYLDQACAAGVTS
mgnify:CR=1 FL=1